MNWGRKKIHDTCNERIDMNSKMSYVKAQVNTFSSHTTMPQKTQGEEYKSPFRETDQSFPPGDYFKQSVCFVVDTEKKL